MDLTEHKLIHNLSKSHDISDSLLQLVNFYAATRKSIPKQPSAFILHKSLTSFEHQTHYALLALVDPECLNATYPGLFSFYLKTLNSCNAAELDECFVFVLDRVRSVTPDILAVFYNYFRNCKVVLSQTFQKLGGCGEDRYRLFYCKRLCEGGFEFDYATVNSFIDGLVKQSLQETGNKFETNVEIKNYNSLFVEEVQTIKYKHSQNSFVDDELDDVMYWINALVKKGKLIHSHQLLNYILSHCDTTQIQEMTRNGLSILTEYIESEAGLYLNMTSHKNFISLCELNFNNTVNIDLKHKRELLFIYLTTYSKNISTTNLCKQMNIQEIVEESYDHIVTVIHDNLSNSAELHKRNVTLLQVLYNLISLNYRKGIERIISRIFDILYLVKNDIEPAMEYLHCLSSLVNMKIIDRRLVRIIFKNLVYLDSDDIQLRCQVYDIIRVIIPDYHEMDTYIMAIENNETQICNYTNPIVKYQRLSDKDINTLNKHNTNVFAAKLWPDLSEKKKGEEIVHYLKLLTAILKHTGTFYERRIQKGSVLHDIIGLILENKWKGENESVYFDFLEALLDLDLSKNNLIYLFNSVLELYDTMRESVCRFCVKMCKRDRYLFSLCFERGVADFECKREVFNRCYLLMGWFKPCK